MKSIVTVALFSCLSIHAGFAANAEGATGITPSVAGSTGPGSLRQRFVPGSVPMKGEAAFQGAAFERLNPSPVKGCLWMFARADIGSKFPVQNEAGAVLFEVRFAKGDDDHAELEVLTKEGSRKIILARDQTKVVKVSGIDYELDFPSIYVAAAANEKPTSPKATFFVTCRS